MKEVNPKMLRYDPWEPISINLYDVNKSDLVENLIGLTGLSLKLSSDQPTHVQRIREYKPIIQTAYDGLPDDEKGRFAQIVAKGILVSDKVPDGIKEKLIDNLNDIGWTITEDGELITQDALLSERFFPPGTTYDAYVAIREILAKAANSAMIVDAYLGSTIFETLTSPESLENVQDDILGDRSLKKRGLLFKKDQASFVWGVGYFGRSLKGGTIRKFFTTIRPVFSAKKDSLEKDDVVYFPHDPDRRTNDSRFRFELGADDFVCRAG